MFMLANSVLGSAMVVLASLPGPADSLTRAQLFHPGPVNLYAQPLVPGTYADVTNADNIAGFELFENAQYIYSTLSGTAPTRVQFHTVPCYPDTFIMQMMDAQSAANYMFIAGNNPLKEGGRTVYTSYSTLLLYDLMEPSTDTLSLQIDPMEASPEDVFQNACRFLKKYLFMEGTEWSRISPGP